MNQIFLKLGNITGDVSNASHPQWIALNTVSLKSLRQNPTGNNFTLPANFSELTATKSLDSASPLLMEATLNTQPFSEATIQFCPSANTQLNQYVLVLSQVLVTEYHTELKTPIIHNETIKLSFSSLQASFTPINAEGTLLSPVTAELMLCSK